MLEITFSLSRVPSPLDASSREGCLRLAVLREEVSRREHYRSEIIKMIVGLASNIPLDLPFVIYDYKSLAHRLNAVEFMKRLKPTGFYWIAMAYYLAIEYTVYDPPSTYVDGQGYLTST